MKNADHRHKGRRYQIIIEEQLDTSWAEWLSDFDVAYKTDDRGRSVTLLTGMVMDQAALNGVLTKIWNLNLTVLSVTQLDEKLQGNRP